MCTSVLVSGYLVVDEALRPFKHCEVVHEDGSDTVTDEKDTCPSVRLKSLRDV